MNKKDFELQKNSLDNSLSKNKYCFCKNYGKPNSCLICQSIDKKSNYSKINCHAVDKYTVAITGTNGKTTLTNVIGTVLSKFFVDKVSYASTTGIYKNGKKFSSLEHRASEHYVYLLNQPDGEIVISEQPEAGIFKYGLPRDHDFGIVTNMAEDHLERYWINSGMDDLYAIKSLVAKMSIEGCITSVDYFWTRKLIEDYNYPQFYLFGRNAAEVKKYQKCYQVTTLDKNEIIILDGNRKISVGKISDFLLTLNGILDYNVENLLAIITLFYTSKKFKPHFLKLIQILKNIAPSFEINPARFNVLNYKGNLIVFDYAHNLDGFENSLKSLRELQAMTTKRELIGLVAIASDRTKDVVDRLEKIFLTTFNEVLVRGVENNSNIAYLSKKLSSKNGAIWLEGYQSFIEKYSTPENIVYITIAGHGHVSDLAKTIENLQIKDINQEIFSK